MTTLSERIKNITVIACDVDGVLTDGRIIFDSAGRELKNFNAADGFGLTLAKEMGFKTVFLSGRPSKVTSIRAKKLGIHRVYLNALPKLKFYNKLLRHFKVKDENVCFIGDDLIDLQVLGRVGLAVCVADGIREAKKIAHYITAKKGGKGAVREVVELILKTQGKWRKVLAKYS